MSVRAWLSKTAYYESSGGCFPSPVAVSRANVIVQVAGLLGIGIPMIVWVLPAALGAIA